LSRSVIVYTCLVVLLYILVSYCYYIFLSPSVRTFFVFSCFVDRRCGGVCTGLDNYNRSHTDTQTHRHADAQTHRHTDAQARRRTDSTE